MALKAVLASLDGLDESLHGEYTKGDDDRYYLEVDGVDEMPAVVGLKQSKQKLLDEKKALAKQIEGFGDLTPDKVQELRESLKAAQKGGGSEKQIKELEDKLAAVQEAAQREKAEIQEAADKDRQAARTYFKTAEIARAVSALKGDPELLEPFIGKHLDVVEQDGRFALKVLGADGQARIKDSHGGSLTIDDLAAEFKANPKYGGMFAAEGKGGSGAQPNAGGGGGSPTTVQAQNGVIRTDPAKIASGEVTVTHG